MDRAAQRRVQAAIELLASEPRPSGAKKLVGGDGEWRVRTGEYRIVYEVHDSVLLVLVVAVGHPGSAVGGQTMRSFRGCELG